MADAPIGSAYLRILPDLSGLNAQLGAYFSGSRFASMGKAAGAALGAGIAAGGALKGLYEIGQAYDDAFDIIRVTTGETGKNLKRLERDFKNVIAGVPTDFDSASTAVADLNQRLELTGKPLQKLSKQMLELSRITDTDVATNVQSVTRLFGDWGVKTEKQSKTLDKLFRASQETGIKVADLADLMVQFGSPLRQLGLDFDTAAAMFSRFEKEGVNIQTLMPGLRYALKNFSQPTDELAATLDRLGISLKDPAEALRGVFEALEKAPSDLKANALAFEVFGARAGPDMAAAVREGRFELDELMKTIRRGKDTIRGAGRDTMDFAEEWTLLKNNLANVIEPLASRVFAALGKEMRQIRRIMTDKSLSTDERFSAVFEHIASRIGELLPKIAKAGLEIGGKLAKGILRGIFNLDTDTKLNLLALLGGAAAIRIAARSAGSLIGKHAGKGIVVGIILALPALLKEWHDFVKKHRVEIINFGSDIGEKIVNGLIAAVNFGIRQINEAMDKANIWAFAGVDAPNIPEIGDVDFGHVREEAKKTEVSLRDLIDGLDKVGGKTRDAGKVWEGYFRGLRDNLDRGNRETGRHDKQVGRSLGDVEGRAKRTRNAWGNYGKLLERTTERGSRDADKHRGKTTLALAKIDDGLKRTSDKGRDYERDFEKTFARVTNRAGKMAKGVGRNIEALANGVGQGLEVTRDNLNKSLGAYEVDAVKFAIRKVGNTVRNVVTAQKGAIVPGAPGESGDRHLLALDGRPIALVERGEQISVLNRTATAALMRINQKLPRRAGGGMVDPAGPGTGVVNRAIADVVGAWSQRYDAAINYGYDPGGGHVSPGHNVTGTATDTGPAAGWGDGPTRLFEQGLRVLVNSGLSVLYGSHGVGTPYDNHGYGNHAHIEWGMHPKISGLAAAAAETLARVILKGPKGPLRDMGQAQLDRARKAANAYLGKHSGGFMGGDVGAPIRSLPEALQKYNRTYPGALFPSDAWYGLYQMPFDAVAALAEWRGMPGITFAQVSKGEGNLRPGSMGDDNGDGQADGYGLWAITRPYGDSYGVKALGGYEPGMLNPVSNAIVAGRMYDAQGPSAWHGTRYVTGWNQHYSGSLLRQRGGLVPHLAKGGLLDFGSIVEATRSHDNDEGKRAKAVKKATERFQDAIKTFGLPEKVVERLVRLRREADVFGEYAGNASSLTDDTGVGRFRGKTEAEWTEKQLTILFKLRNRLLAAKKIVEKRIREQTKLLKEAEKRLKQTNREIKSGDREREDLEKRLEKAKDAKDKDLQKHLQDKLDSLDERQKLRKAVAAKLKTPVIASLKSLGKRLKSDGKEYATASSLKEAITSVQGSGEGGIFARRLRKLPQVGTLGGEIFDAQVSLRNLRADANPTDPEAGFSIDELRSVIEAARFGAFDRDLPTFHGGGIIPGQPGQEVEVRGLAGEGVFTEEQMAAMGKGRSQAVTVENHFDYEGMDLYVLTLVDGQIAKREKIARRSGRQVVR